MASRPFEASPTKSCLAGQRSAQLYLIEYRMIVDSQNPNRICLVAHVFFSVPRPDSFARNFSASHVLRPSLGEVYARPAVMVSSTSVPASTSLHTASLPPESFGPFAHTTQTVVSGALRRRSAALGRYPCRHPGPARETAGRHTEFPLRSARLRVAEGVAQGLACDPIDFVPQDRMEIPRSCLPPVREHRRHPASPRFARKFCPSVVRAAGKIVGLDRGRAQPLYASRPSVIACSRLIDRRIQALFGFGDIRTISEQIRSRLKQEQQLPENFAAVCRAGRARRVCARTRAHQVARLNCCVTCGRRSR